MTNANLFILQFLEKYGKEDVEYILWHMARNAVGCKYVKAHIRITIMDFYKDVLKILPELYSQKQKENKEILG